MYNLLTLGDDRKKKSYEQIKHACRKKKVTTTSKKQKKRRRSNHQSKPLTFRENCAIQGGVFEQNHPQVYFFFQIKAKLARMTRSERKTKRNASREKRTVSVCRDGGRFASRLQRLSELQRCRRRFLFSFQYYCLVTRCCC